MVDVAKIRSECVHQLTSIRGSHHSYFTELEGRIYDWSGKPQSYNQLMSLYYRKYLQLLYNLSQYYDHLTTRYTPSELICLGETELNPKVRQEREQNEEQYRYYKQILSKGIEDENDTEDDVLDGNATKCRKCNNTKSISIMLRQLRGADEPMSQFITCNKCGFHWRVG